MGLFACTRCGSVDNTAFTNYSVRQWDGDPPLCSACDPNIGKWHDLFARRHWTVDDDLINRDEVTVSTTESSTTKSSTTENVEAKRRTVGRHQRRLVEGRDGDGMEREGWFCSHDDEPWPCPDARDAVGALPPAGQLKPGQVWAWIHDEVWRDPTDPEPPGHWEIRGTGALLEPE
jgi:hypothetical protein